MSLASLISSAFSVDISNIVSTRLLDGSHPDDVGRVERYRKVGGLTNETLIGVVGTTADGNTVEYLAYVPSTTLTEVPSVLDNLKFVVGRCDITYEDLSPTQCIEYAFPDEIPCPTWHLSKTSNDGYQHFLACKFKVWEKAMKEPSCEAAFRRMLQRGLVYQMYDSNMFPSPEHLVAKYRVTDETSGKVMELPHPVSHCRVWRGDLQSFEDLSVTLDGAPRNDDEARVYWATLIAELEALRGAEYIKNLLEKPSSE